MVEKTTDPAADVPLKGLALGAVEVAGGILLRTLAARVGVCYEAAPQVVRVQMVRVLAEAFAEMEAVAMEVDFDESRVLAEAFSKMEAIAVEVDFDESRVGPSCVEREDE